jgi:hypothetical protein
MPVVETRVIVNEPGAAGGIPSRLGVQAWVVAVTFADDEVFPTASFAATEIE